MKKECWPDVAFEVSWEVCNKVGGIHTVIATKIPEMEKHYPEGTMYGTLPSFGMFIRHAENISISDSHFSCIEEDVRPPVVSEDVLGLKYPAP